ncbi:Uncharacterised protein [BD1-7 clade bacterium]|nr:Uncharacterised protein [BD1-7 clade bacterium]
MAKLRENEFTLSMAGISDFTFELDDYSITKGQPWEGVSTDETSDSGTLIVKAGRKGSKDVAKWFKDKSDGGSVVGCSSSSKYPDKLNFAFTGTLIFTHGKKTIKCKNVLIGQGHSTRNTWWLGGADMTGMDTPFGGVVISPVKGYVSSPLGRLIFASYVGQISSMEMGLVSL